MVITHSNKNCTFLALSLICQKTAGSAMTGIMISIHFLGIYRLLLSHTFIDLLLNVRSSFFDSIQSVSIHSYCSHCSYSISLHQINLMRCIFYCHFIAFILFIYSYRHFVFCVLVLTSWSGLLSAWLACFVFPQFY